MKLTKSFLFLLCATLLIQSSQAQINNADTMVHRIFATLKAKDEKAYIALYPSAQQMARLMTTLVKGIAEEMKQAQAKTNDSKPPANADNMNTANFDSIITAQLMKKATPEEMAKSEKRYAKDFNKIIVQGEERGINWNNIVLVSYKIDTVRKDDESMVKLFGSDQFKGMKGIIHFKSGDSAYQISFDESMYLPEEGGWYGAKLENLVREGEKLPGDDVYEKKEVVIESIEEDTPPPPPATSKTKTKTKTPARKPATKS